MLAVTVMVMIFSTTNYWRILFHQLISQGSTKNNITITMDFKTWSAIKKVNKKEVIINNRFFDIENISFRHETVTVKGHYDDHEKDLREQISGIQKNSKQCLVFTTFFYVEELDFLVFGKRFRYHLNFYKPYNNHYVNHWISHDIPPPRISSAVA